ncbi:hypothetical protein KGM48_00640 [Patescibacteria group bacterium]|nr:hypothetical protein [Patescibacteria group bacterium]
MLATPHFILSMNFKRNAQEKFNTLFERELTNYKYAEGVKKLQTFLDTHSFLKENPENLTKLGLLYDHAAMVDKKDQKSLEGKARGNYKKALSLNSIFPPAWWGLARIYWHNGDKRAVPLALKAYRYAKAAARKDDGQYAQNIGLVYHKLGNNRRAKYWLERGVAKSPREWGVHYNLMRFYLDTQNHNAARKSARKVLSLLTNEKNSQWTKDVRRLAEATLAGL